MLGYHTQHKYQIPRANKWKCLNQEWVTSSGVWISLLSIAKINKYNNQKQLREEMICLFTFLIIFHHWCKPARNLSWNGGKKHTWKLLTGLLLAGLLILFWLLFLFYFILNFLFILYTSHSFPSLLFSHFLPHFHILPIHFLYPSHPLLRKNKSFHSESTKSGISIWRRSKLLPQHQGWEMHPAIRSWFQKARLCTSSRYWSHC